MPIDVQGPVSPLARNWNSIDAMSVAVALAVSETVPRKVEPGSPAVPSGGVVSIVTFAECSVSTLPARSVERNWIVWTPSFEWSAGAGTTTVVPVWKLPLSTLYCVVETPEPVSTAVRVTVMSEDCACDGAFAVVVGGVLSTRTLVTAD